MAEIIKFKKPKEKSLEDKFMETLSLEQMEMFASMMVIASADQQEREESLINRICCLEFLLDEKDLISRFNEVIDEVVETGSYLIEIETNKNVYFLVATNKLILIQIDGKEEPIWERAFNKTTYQQGIKELCRIIKEDYEGSTIL